jgi:hypothetical protein
MNSKIFGIGLNTLKYLIVVFGSILFAIIVTGDLGTLDSPVANALMMSQWVIYLCAAAIVGFGIYHVARDVKKNIPILIGIALFVIIMFIGYSMAEGVETEVVNGTQVTVISATAAKWSGAGLKMLYILLTITVGVALFSEVKKLIR